MSISPLSVTTSPDDVDGLEGEGIAVAGLEKSGARQPRAVGYEVELAVHDDERPRLRLAAHADRHLVGCRQGNRGVDPRLGLELLGGERLDLAPGELQRRRGVGRVAVDARGIHDHGLSVRRKDFDPGQAAVDRAHGSVEQRYVAEREVDGRGVEVAHAGLRGTDVDPIRVAGQENGRRVRRDVHLRAGAAKSARVQGVGRQPAGTEGQPEPQQPERHHDEDQSLDQARSHQFPSPDRE